MVGDSRASLGPRGQADWAANSSCYKQAFACRVSQHIPSAGTQSQTTCLSLESLEASLLLLTEGGGPPFWGGRVVPDG